MQQNTRLGARVRQIRNLRELDVLHVSAHLGISTVLYSRWERGERAMPAVSMVALAAVFDVCLAFLMGDNDCHPVQHDPTHDLVGLMLEPHGKEDRCSDPSCWHRH